MRVHVLTLNLGDLRSAARFLSLRICSKLSKPQAMQDSRDLRPSSTCRKKGAQGGREGEPKEGQAMHDSRDLRPSSACRKKGAQGRGEEGTRR